MKFISNLLDILSGRDIDRQFDRLKNLVAEAKREHTKREDEVIRLRQENKTLRKRIAGYARQDALDAYVEKRRSAKNRLT